MNMHYADYVVIYEYALCGLCSDLWICIML